MIAKDFLFDDDEDLRIENGDLVIGDSDAQHIQDIIMSGPGWYKEFPAMGVNARIYLGSSGKEQELQRSIQLNLQSDGYRANMVRVKQNPNGTFEVSKIDATRT
jgi:hypothetical protein